MSKIEALKEYMYNQGAIKQDLKPYMLDGSESYFIDYGAIYVIVTINKDAIEIKVGKGDKAIIYTESLDLFSHMVVDIAYWYHYIVDDLRAKL